jgi:hypothetical protein
MYYQRNRSKTILHVLAALLLSAALAATAGAQTNVAFFDGTFDLQQVPNGPGWTSLPAGYSGTSATPTMTLTQMLSKGNPGDWLEETHTLVGTDAYVYFFVYNPANTFTGTFGSLNYSYELRGLPTSGGAYRIAVQQGGTVYAYNTTVEEDVVNAGKTWTTAPNPYFVTGMTASQFCAIPSNVGQNNFPSCSLNPDFSNPTTTVFGYTVESSFLTGPGGGTYGSGIDNWCVVLIGASGPGGTKEKCGGSLGASPR